MKSNVFIFLASLDKSSIVKILNASLNSLGISGEKAFSCISFETQTHWINEFENNNPKHRKINDKKCEEIRISKAMNLKKSKLSPKRDILFRYLAEIDELHKAGVGFRLIARYLSEQRNVGNISASYIHKVHSEFFQE